MRETLGFLHLFVVILYYEGILKNFDHVTSFFVQNLKEFPIQIMNITAYLHLMYML